MILHPLLWIGHWLYNVFNEEEHEMNSTNYVKRALIGLYQLAGMCLVVYLGIEAFIYVGTDTVTYLAENTSLGAKLWPWAR